MATAREARLETVEYRADQVFGRIGKFLTEHRLSPDPLHYAFAYRVISQPDGVLAKSVAALTEGGIRLTARDIEKLGGQITNGQAPTIPEVCDPVAGLVAQTQMQVEGFTDMMHAIRAETQGFGRDLAASADAMRTVDSTVDMVQLTEVMLDRVQSAEARLAAATHEAEELRLKLEEAQSNARSDPLTNLPNRRAFEECFVQHSSGGETLCLAVCDVDRFKRVNDRFGHSVGDRVLKAIAETLLKNCAGHMVARYGGEEFTVLFVGITLEEAYATLERARATVAEKRYRLRESDEPLGAVTFSAGVTQAHPDEFLGSAFGRADKLLYAAKDAGRNQIRRV
ncbi:diguanylate cyclase [Sphingomonas sp. PvP055]|uniref:GGDEF domain-containing protein n=1 Tax=Sphingomonas sp. PvP055 TaxID=3156391 RepID=UPI0033920D1C